MMKKQQGLIFWCMLALLCLVPKESFAQNINVRGKVIDETGEAMISVSVQVKGTSQGTVTNADGDYDLQNVSPNATLVFRYLGYVTREVNVTGGRIDVTMNPDSQLLEEVVIVAYGAQKKVTVTGALANVGTEELLKSPTPSLSNALAGRLPGLQSVQYTGLPGEDIADLWVRGIGSSNSQSALVLVDGIERSLAQIDPNEVADITILKDASSTAVFGVRGAAGVILVTTRRGEIGKATVSVTGSAGLQHATQYVKMTNSYEYATAYNLAQARDGIAESGLRFSKETIQHFKDRDNLLLYPDTDWIKYMMNDYAWMNQQNINVRGGTEAVQYFVSVGALYQDGFYKNYNFDPEENFKYRRYNYRANIDINLTKKSTLSVNIGGSINNRTHIGGDEEELYGYLIKSVPFSGYGLDDQGRRIISDPNLTADYEDSDLGRFYKLGYVKISNNVTNLDLMYKLNLESLTKGLTFDVKGSYNSDYSQTKNRKNGYGQGIKYKATIVDGVVDENGNPKTVLVRQGDIYPLPYTEGRNGGRNWTAEAALRYNRRFDNHNVSGLAMYTQTKNYYPISYTDIPRGYVGFVGRATYDYSAKYLFEFNLGYNGSENFAKGRRYGVFPAFSVGWVPSSEAFWDPVRSVVSFMKLRASYGIVGSDAGGGRFAYLPSGYAFINGTNNNNGDDNGNNRGANFGMNSNYWYPGARETSVGNPNITWETHYKQNYGIDMNFLNDRLSISVDVFHNLATNIITSNSATLPSILAIPSSYINYNEVLNRGFEVQLTWKERYKDFSYSLSPFIAFARNKRVKTLETPKMYDYLYSNGSSTYTPFMYEFFEFYKAGETEKRYIETFGVKEFPDMGALLKDGDNVYVDLNKDGVVDANDQHYVGYGDVPEYTWSFNMNFTYKRFNLSLLWNGAANANRLLEGGFYRQTFGATANSGLTKWVYDNSWTEENADKALLPRLTFANLNYNNQRVSRIWRVDASYTRLKNAEFGYTIPRIPAIQGLRNLNIYITGQNLLTFSKFKGNDPEARGSVTYPILQIINLGFRVQF